MVMCNLGTKPQTNENALANRVMIADRHVLDHDNGHRMFIV